MNLILISLAVLGVTGLVAAVLLYFVATATLYSLYYT